MANLQESALNLALTVTLKQNGSVLDRGGQRNNVMSRLPPHNLQPTNAGQQDWPPKGVRWYYTDSHVALAHADCRAVLPELGPVDLVLADPPYGDTQCEWDQQVSGWLPLLRTDQLWCFGSLRFFLSTPFCGWRHAQEIIWQKLNGTNCQVDRFRRVHELVTHFLRAGVKWGDVYKNPLFTFNGIPKNATRTKVGHGPHVGTFKQPHRYDHSDKRLMTSIIVAASLTGSALHPTQKPFSIIAPLLEYSCPPGGLVLDPFMGSGTTLVVAKRLGRRAIGIEIDERYCEIAVRRLAQAVLPFPVPAPPQPEQPPLFDT